MGGEGNDSSDDHTDEPEEENEDDEEEHSNVPLDRGWAWATCVGAFFIFSMVVGVLKSFGVLLLELSRRYDAPASLLTSSQSLCGFLHLGIGPISNAICQRFNHRKVIFIGGLIGGLGLILTGYVRSVELFFVTYGIMTGFGFGLCLSPSLIFPGIYFKKKLAIANGISSAGSGAGAFVFPNLMRYLLDKYMLEGCLLLLGGIALNVSACACLFRPASFWSKSGKNGRRSKELELLNPIDRKGNVNNLNEINRGLYPAINGADKLSSSIENSLSPVKDSKVPYETAVSLSAPCLHNNLEPFRERRDTVLSECNSPRVKKRKNLNDSALLFASIESIPVAISSTKKTNHHDVECTDRSKPTKKSRKKFIDCKLFLNPYFQVLNIGIFFGIFAHHVIYNIIPPLANEIGFSDTEGALCVSVVGITDLIGRMSSGLVSDTFHLRRKTVFQTNMFIYGCLIVLLIHMDTLVGFLITCGFLGFFTGGYIGIQISVLAERLGRENLATSWGYAAFFAAISIFISPILAGLLKDHTDSWIPGFWMASGAALTGSLSLSFINLLEFRSKRKRSK